MNALANTKVITIHEKSNNIYCFLVTQQSHKSNNYIGYMTVDNYIGYMTVNIWNKKLNSEHEICT
jgi:hypothetical protein